ncbi:MAG: class I SAM-dependent methyltransferase [Dactylosporangium sp.]|nr:hypothetical protein [Dactylosporangium sp.]NNJ63798.1 class I SAM-dependent methyltransferase [Dactylosporangium sp.]
MPDIESNDDRAGKSNFESIYHAPDPREYFRVLVGLDYIIPNLAKVIFRSLVEHRQNQRGAPLKVVDIGSSYGINSAVVNHPLDIERLARRYQESEIYALPSEELADLDRNYFASWPKLSDATFVGVDTSVPAASYAQSVGLLDHTVTSDLERSDPSADEQRLLSDTDLIISTGCVGYVTEKTFGRVLNCHQGPIPPIVASFVLRMYPYTDIESRLSQFGLVTEKMEGITFVQRRFASQQECTFTVDTLNSMGIDSRGKEADGLLHAELFVSRTKEAIDDLPLGELVSITLGENSTRGRRFKRTECSHTEFVQ